MSRAILVDTGPLVAYFVATDVHHAWAVVTLATINPPLLTCEAVLAETCHLLQRAGNDGDCLNALVERALLRLPFCVEKEIGRVRRLMRKYADLPMSLADGCLVRMSELTTACAVLTVDHHFRAYRRFERQPIPLIMPPDSRP